MKNESLDQADRQILHLLRDDGRMSMASLADKVHVSRANAYARVERMRGEGVIEGFSARVNAARAGMGVSAFVFCKVRQPARPVLSGPLQDIPGVEYASFVTGEYDLMMLVRAPSVEKLRDDSMSRLYWPESPVVSTHTVLVLDEIVNRPYVLP